MKITILGWTTGLLVLPGLLVLDYWSWTTGPSRTCWRRKRQTNNERFLSYNSYIKRETIKFIPKTEIVCEKIVGEARVNECSIWNNSLVHVLVRISKYRLFFYKHWAKAGVHNMKDLVDDNFKVITYTDFRGKYFLSASFFESWFYGVPSAIRSAIKSLKLRMQDGKDQGFSVQKLIAVTSWLN